MKQGVVQIGRYYTGWVKYSDQQNRQEFPQLAQCPGSIREKPMISIVSFLSGWVCEWQNAGDSPANSTQNPAFDQPDKYFCSRNGKNEKKLIDYIRPCRNSRYSVHSNLRVLTFPLNTSDGCYFFVHDSWLLAA